MKQFVLLLYYFYRYMVTFLYVALGLTLWMYDITYKGSLFWIVMLLVCAIQFVAYANGMRAQLEKRFKSEYNKIVKKTLEEGQQNKYNQFGNN